MSAPTAAAAAAATTAAAAATASAVPAIAKALNDVRATIASTLATHKLTDRVPPVRLVAVSKLKPVEDLRAAYDAGQRVFGENYVKELVDKAPQLPDDVRWHFIGNLQSNKVNVVTRVPNLWCVETVDSVKLADRLNAAVLRDAVQAARPADEKRLRVMVQVNTSGEASKGGVAPGDEVVALTRHIRASCAGLRLTGLMTIGRFDASPKRDCFQSLVDCRTAVVAAFAADAEAAAAPAAAAPETDTVVDDDSAASNTTATAAVNGDFLELSMGMSGDYPLAIEMGSTNVRVGSTIFGART